MIQPSETWREWNLPSDSSARFLFDPRYQQILPKERRKDLFSRVRKFAQEYIQMPRQENYKLDGPNGEEFIFTLLGKGDGGQGYVYSLDEDFCLKIAAIGKNVSKYQENQFSINYARSSLQSINISGREYTVATVPTLAIFSDDLYVYTLMPIAKGFVSIKRANIPIRRKLSIGEHILQYFYSNYFSNNNPFNDLNISNIMIDIEKRIILLIDPYVPEIA